MGALTSLTYFKSGSLLNSLKLKVRDDNTFMSSVNVVKPNIRTDNRFGKTQMKVKIHESSPLQVSEYTR